MIIECINCHKKFVVNSDLIPTEGRNIQCGSCNHLWFFKPDIIQKKIDLGLPLDSRLNAEFESIQRHKNYIFSSGIDLIHEFFNLERKTKNDFLSKSIQYFNKNSFKWMKLPYNCFMIKNL